jgi:prevent-host-death family protein
MNPLKLWNRMQTLSAKDAKYGFGRLIDLARAEPVAVAKHWRPVVVVLSVEEYDRAESATEHKCRVTSEKCRKIRKE